MLTLALALMLQTPPKGDDVDAMIKQFKKDFYKEHERDGDKRESDVVTLAGRIDERIVPILCDAYDKERVMNRVRAKIAESLGNFGESEAAADKLAEIVKDPEVAKPDEIHRLVLMRAFTGLSKLSVKVKRTKEIVDSVCAFLSNKDNKVSATAGRCLATTRSGDAIEPLLKEMLANQNNMKHLIREGADNCDGG